MDIVSDLKLFYDDQADKFHSTRKKFYPEFKIISDLLKGRQNKKLRILELGCGSGRLLKYLINELKLDVEYIGVDISKNLIEIARLENPSGKFHVKDMIEFTRSLDQNSFDYVIAIASFQHIYSQDKRIELLNNLYKILDYDSKLFMINWSFSKWFLRKYKKEVFQSFFRNIFSFGKYSFNDVFIPWKSEDYVYKRYYHIYNFREIEKLLKLTGFVRTRLEYSDNNGDYTLDWKVSRNTITFAEKGVLK